MKQQDTLRVIRKYYLNKLHNHLIIGIMVCFNFIYLIKLIPSLDVIITNLGQFSTITGITILTVLSYLHTRKQIKNNFYHVKKEKKEPFLIQRNSYLEKLRNVNGCLFLLGESGIGKSCLLEQLINGLGNSTSIDFIKNNYFNCSQQITGSNYIIFDQFERILDISDPFKIIKLIKKYDDGNRTMGLSH